MENVQGISEATLKQHQSDRRAFVQRLSLLAAAGVVAGCGSSKPVTEGAAVNATAVPAPPPVYKYIDDYGAVGDDVADDTQALQNAINDTKVGTLIGTAGKTYKTTKAVTIANPIILDLNRSAVHCTANASAIFIVTANNVTVRAGELYGNFKPTDSVNAGNGLTGIQFKAHFNSAINLYLHDLSSYGILQNADIHYPTVMNCVLVNIGYIGMFFHTNNTSTHGGLIFGNLVDRRDIPADTITQGCIMVRGSGSKEITTTSWLVANNEMFMPINPKDASAECMEIRELTYNSIVSGNYCNGGTIGVSFVQSSYCVVSGNQCLNNRDMGVEIGAANYNTVNGNIIQGMSKTGGITIDSTSKYNTFSGNVVLETSSHCIYASAETSHNSITGGSLTPAAGQNGVYFHGNAYCSLVGVSIWGNGVANKGVMVDNGQQPCTGLNITGCTIADFKQNGVFFYGAGGTVMDDYIIANNIIKNCNTPIGQSLSGGATIGTNSIINNIS